MAGVSVLVRVFPVDVCEDFSVKIFQKVSLALNLTDSVQIVVPDKVEDVSSEIASRVGVSCHRRPRTFQARVVSAHSSNDFQVRTPRPQGDEISDVTCGRAF